MIKMRIAELLVIFALVGCGPDPAKHVAVGQTPTSTSAELVESTWRANEAIIAHAISGGVSGEQSYISACRFFEELTGIEIRGEGTYAGWLPNEHTPEDLRAVQNWYSKNKHRLYWDEEAKAVKVRLARSRAQDRQRWQG